VLCNVGVAFGAEMAMRPDGRALCVNDPHFPHTIGCIDADLAAFVITQARIRDLDRQQNSGAVERREIEVAAIDAKIRLQKCMAVEAQSGFWKDGESFRRRTLEETVEFALDPLATWAPPLRRSARLFRPRR
jgi:hypothetical protein